MHIQLNTFRVSFGFLFLKPNLNLALVTQVIFMNILKSLYRESLRRFICMKYRQRDKIFSQFFNFSCYFQLTKKIPLEEPKQYFSSCFMFSKYSSLNTEMDPKSTQTKFILKKYPGYTESLCPKYDL